jgi:hypothetical protein
MPVDLSAAGLPSVYPTNRPRFATWLIIWALCCGIAVPVALLLWPSGEPARGTWFWICIAGAPNALFLLLLGIARAGYEAAYVHALYRNQHRQVWLSKRISDAQRSLQVLGVGYCLPFEDKRLAEAATSPTPLLTAQTPRSGSGRIVHGRFAEGAPLPLEGPFDDGPPPATNDAKQDGASEPSSAIDSVSPAVWMIAHALAPLTGSLHALSQYGNSFAPAVRVLVPADDAEPHMQHVRHALHLAGLPMFDCSAVPAADGLLLADAWLDAAEKRPLLVIAAEWHDGRSMPAIGSTEGSVAVLLGPGVFQLPELVTVLGMLHRPVAYDFAMLGDTLANAVLWGKVEATSIKTAWISGLDATHDTALLAALGNASLTSVAQLGAQRRVDRIIGRAGVADGWLSIAAAIESGVAGPHLILHNTRTAQAAVLHVNPLPSHDQSDE